MNHSRGTPDETAPLDRDDQINAAIADFLDADSAGTPFNDQTFLEQYPDLRTELEEFLADRQLFANAAPSLAPSSIHSSLMPTGGYSTSPDKPHPSFSQELPRHFGDYLLLEEIGRGGMGVIYRAHQVSLDRMVAVKLILAGQLASQTLVDRFDAEAKAIAQLQHPNFVRIYEVGRNDGQHYISMEYVEGASLDNRIRRQPIPMEQAVDLVRHMAGAIEYAHQRGILHRDLKPSNVLLGHDLEPKITDFGLAKTTSDSRSLTATGEVLGTPCYMPPEQAVGDNKAIGPQSDIYSLGAILYELLTGRPPFLASSAVETLIQARKNEVISPRLLNQSVSLDLETICLKCLEKDPQKRYSSAAALGDDLHRYQTEQPITARRVGKVERSIRWCRRNPALATLVAVVLLAFCGGAIQSARVHYYYFKSVAAGEKLENEKQLAIQKTLEAELAQKELIKQTQEAFDQTELARLARTREQKALFVANINLARQAIDEGNLRRAADLIDPYSRYPQNLVRDELSRYCSFDWYLLWRKIHQQSEQAFPHGGLVSSVCLTRSGETLVTAQTHKTIKTWNVNTGGLSSTFVADAKYVHSIALSVDEKQLYSLGSEGLRVWDLATSKLVRWERFTVTDPRAHAFSPDRSRVVYGVKPFDLALVDTATGKVVHRLEGHTADLNAAAFSPDGSWLATTGYDHKIRIWDVDTGEQKRTFDLNSKRHAYSIGFSADGSQLAVGTNWKNGGIEVWDFANGERILEMSGHDGYVESIEFSADGQRLVTGSRDQTVGIWNLKTSMMIAQLPGHSDRVTRVGFMPDDDRVYSAAMDGTTRIWNIPSVDAPEPDVIELSSVVNAIAWSPDGQILASGTNGWGVMLHDRGGRQIRELRGHRGGVLGVAFSPDGKLLASCSRDATIQLWDCATWTNVATLESHDADVRTVAFSHDSSQLGSADIKATFKLWNVATKEVIKSESFPDENGQRHSIYDVAFSYDGRQVALSGDGLIVIDLATGKSKKLNGETYAGDAVEYSHDAEWLASSAKADAVFLRSNHDASYVWLKGHSNRVMDIVFTPDGKTVITCGRDRSIKIWDLPTGQERLTLHGHTDSVMALALTQDGKTLASASADGIIRLWRAASDEDVLAMTPTEMPKHVQSLATRSGFSAPPAVEQVELRLNAIAEVERLGGRVIRDVQAHDRVLNVYLEGQHINDESLKILSPLVELRLLSLRDTSVTGAGLEHLSALRDLNEIVLVGESTEGQELTHLKQFPSLQSLHIGRGFQTTRFKAQTRRQRRSNVLKDEDMKHVADVEKLSYFTLDNAEVTKLGLQQLTKSKPNMRMLQIMRTPTISKQEAKSLMEELPDTDVTFDEPLKPKTKNP